MFIYIRSRRSIEMHQQESSIIFSLKLWKRIAIITVVFIFSGIYFTAFVQNTNSYSLTHLNQTTNNSQIKSNRSRIRLVIFSDLDAQKHYRDYTDTLFCYAHRHHYDFSIVNPHDYSACKTFENYFFKKQCTVLQYLIQNPDVEWLVVLDGDIFVVNATKSLDSYIPTDPNIHLIHLERFMNNEITAGCYIIHNHPWSLVYLNRWIEYSEISRKIPYHNSDNGALHLNFLNMSGMSDSQTYDRCARLYNESVSELSYMKYVSCTKCALKGKRKFSNIILYRRGHSFCRDPGLSPHKIHQFDVMFHGYKSKKLDYFLEEPTDRLKCQNELEWTPKIRRSLLVANMTEAKTIMSNWEQAVSKRYTPSVFYPEISNCWPDCESEITGDAWKAFVNILCKF